MVACEDVNHQPSVALVADQTVVVGDTLRLVLAGTDPDGDRLDFRVTGLPDSARIVARSDTEAVLYWSPAITDTEPGGRTYEVRVTVDDGRGGRAETSFDVLVVTPAGAPVFTLPSGVVLNLAERSDVELLVSVKDDDSVSVALAMPEAPEGAKLQEAGAKSAFFYWRPTEEQARTVVHRVVFTATDESHAPVTHVLSVVVLYGGQQTGCRGTAPVVTPPALGDITLEGAGMLPVAVHATDQESALRSVEVEWFLGEGAAAPTRTALVQDSEELTLWRATLDVAQAGSVPASGALLRYAVWAQDNDDPTGEACDRATRWPKVGWSVVAVYPAGAPPDACVDDPAEPDDTTAQAPPLAAGSYDGRRLCGDAPDLARVTVAAGGEIAAQVHHDLAQGPITLRLLDASGQTLDEDASGLADLSVRFQADQAAEVFVEVSAADPAARVTYALDLAVDAVSCVDDAHEPDSAASSAPPLSPGSPQDLVLCPGDDDYFRVDLSPGDRLTALLAFDNSAGDLDLELRSLDGQTLLTASAGQSSAEELTWTAGPADTGAVLRVLGVGGVGNAYTLSVDVLPASEQCADDLLAGNGTATQAVTLFSGVYENLVACPGREDWFAVDLNGGETLAGIVEPGGDASSAGGGADLEVAVLDAANGPPLDTATPDADGLAWAEAPIAAPGRYYIRVRGGATRAVYTLLQTVTDADACGPDRFDPNDSPGAAAVVAPGVLTALRLCAGELDAFAVTAAPFTKIEVYASHDPGAGHVRLRLLGPDGAELASAEGDGHGAAVAALGEQAGLYTVEVQGVGVSHLLYDLAIFAD